MSYLQKSCIALSIKIQTAEDNVTNGRARNLKPAPPYLKGPLQYLVAMIRGCHACAILLPVDRKFFARFLASRRRPSPVQVTDNFFISLQ